MVQKMVHDVVRTAESKLELHQTRDQKHGVVKPSQPFVPTDVLRHGRRQQGCTQQHKKTKNNATLSLHNRIILRYEQRPSAIFWWPGTGRRGACKITPTHMSSQAGTQ